MATEKLSLDLYLLLLVEVITNAKTYKPAAQSMVAPAPAATLGSPAPGCHQQIQIIWHV